MGRDRGRLLDLLPERVGPLDPRRAELEMRLCGYAYSHVSAGLARRWNLPPLLADAQAVLDSLVPIERETCTTGGTWYLARIQPYRTMDNVIDGVVLTFNDVTERVQAIAARRARDLAEAIVDTVREPLVVLDQQLHVVAVNRAYVSCFGGPASGLLGHSFYAVGGRLWDVAPMHDLLDTVPPAERTFEARELTHVIPGMGPQNLRLSARRVTENGGSTELLLLNIEVLPDHPPQT